MDFDHVRLNFFRDNIQWHGYASNKEKATEYFAQGFALNLKIGIQSDKSNSTQFQTKNIFNHVLTSSSRIPAKKRQMQAKLRKFNCLNIFYKLN